MNPSPTTLQESIDLLNQSNRFQILRDQAFSEEIVLRLQRAEKILVVTQPDAYQFSGADSFLKPALAPGKTQWFTEFSPNPKWEEIQPAAEKLSANPVDCILAVGGGSVLDTAKCLKGLPAHLPEAESCIRGVSPISGVGPEMLALPTTSGTGSEATHFAVIYLNGKKYSLAHPSLLPDLAVIDPKLTSQMPPALTACTGLDALCQGIESWWAASSSAESRVYSKIAIQLAWQYLEAATLKPDPESRLAMACASHAAGRAINLTKTTAPHALSYTLTSHWGIPHGHAVALFLPEVWRYNHLASENEISSALSMKVHQERMQELLQLMGQCELNAAIEEFRNRLAALGLASRLGEAIQLTPDDFHLLAGSVNAERLANNPRILSKEALEAIVRDS